MSELKKHGSLDLSIAVLTECRRQLLRIAHEATSREIYQPIYCAIRAVEAEIAALDAMSSIPPGPPVPAVPA